MATKLKYIRSFLKGVTFHRTHVGCNGTSQYIDKTSLLTKRILSPYGPGTTYLLLKRRKINVYLEYLFPRP